MYILYCGYPLVVIIVPIAHWSMYYFIGREEGKIMWKVRAKKWYEKFVAVEDKKKTKKKMYTMIMVNMRARKLADVKERTRERDRC